jgi:hypothetical protein
MASSFMQSRTKKRWAIAGALAAAIGGGTLALGQQPAKPPVQTLPADVAANRAAPDTAAPATPAAQLPPTTGNTPSAPPVPTDAAGNPVVVTPPKPPQDPTRARITFTTIPMTNAKIVWGKTTLGMVTPKQALTVVRPRDTGPLDVMVYAPGYLPVQVRAHTFEDAQVIVKLTTPENMSTLWGYRAPIDAGMPADQLGTPAPEDAVQSAPPL